VVADNGRGMTPEVAARVYEPFYTTRRSAGGSGLGLHITHSLLTRRFTGSIDLDTAPGDGTRWTLCLPFGTQALQRPEPHDAPRR
jgi:signal transduction histidine kinase